MNEQEVIKNYFDARASEWDHNVQHNPDKIKLILEVTELKENSKILDLGTGTGILIDFLEQYAPKEILALDLSDEMINQAKKKFSYNNLTFLNMDYYNCNLKNIDYLICYSAYPHFLNKRLFCQKTFEVLASSGRFVIAHSQNKININKRHNDKTTARISKKLKSAFEEAKVFLDKFNVDIIIDTNELFIISGIKNN